MKNCPICQSVNEESYDLCWKCQYSFTENESVSMPDQMEDGPEIHVEKVSEPDFIPEIEKSREEEKIFSSGDSMVFCPNCNKEVSNTYLFCPSCQHQFKIKSILSNLSPNGSDLKIDCLRCNSSMYFRGNFKFHEGRRVGVYGNLFELFTNRESYDLYFCVKCKKVEFFLPRAKKKKED